MKQHRRALTTVACALWLATSGGCIKSTDRGSDGEPSTDTPADGTMKPDVGATEFVSADTSNGASASQDDEDGSDKATADTEEAGAALADNGAQAGGNRSVERGDIYKLLDDGRLLNLNRYRGVQIIDIGDPSNPVIEGELPMSGDPVEMYVVDDVAFVLLNNYQSYYGSRDDIEIESVRGGLVAAVDLTDRSKPKLIDQAVVTGDIRTSRLTTGETGSALYVAASLWYWEEFDRGAGDDIATDVAAVGGSRTVIKSFAVDGSQLLEKNMFELAGDIADIQATTDYMMVARYDYEDDRGRSKVSLIDISSPDGEMAEAGEVTTQGQVQNKFNMDIKGTVLRIASGRNWNDEINHVETFDISDPDNIVQLDHCTFGDNEDLFATLFVDNSAFFVTYFRTDPFHAFSIDDQGQCEEQSEFVVSGWNSFFRTVSDSSRLIGIGTNDENNNRTMAVSLYDITDLSNASPLVARAEVALSSSYSEGSWDDRAFAVVEDAASAQAADGTAETGLILLPFQGWDEQEQTYVTAVQLFTFSDTTLTQRGVMQHETEVRRSFLAEQDLAANLSDQALSLYDTQDPDMPRAEGKVELAPNYRDVFAFGEHLARVRGGRGNYYYYRAKAATLTAAIDVVKADGDLATSKPLASIQVPATARLKQVGDLLVSIDLVDTTDWDKEDPERTMKANIEVFDFSNPEDPESVGTLNTTQLTPGSEHGYYAFEDIEVADCFDCGGYYGYYGDYDDGIYAVGNALVFAEPTQRRESLGVWEECYTYPTDGGRNCWASSDGDSGCSDNWTEGGIQCTTPAGGEERCEGEILRCTEAGCEKADSSVPTRKECYTDERFRYWSSYNFEVLDLSDPSELALGETIELPREQAGTSIMANGDMLYFNYQKPIDPRDGRPLIKRYVRLLSLANAAAPELSAGINIPGEVIAADGQTLFTRDRIWGDDHAETMVAKVSIDDEVATLDAEYVLSGREVETIALDDAGHVLVTHGFRYQRYTDENKEDTSTKLTLLDADMLSKISEVSVDRWGGFQTAKAGRAVFSVSGGVLIMNTEDAAKPFAQAYFPTSGGGQLLVSGDDLIFAAGPYGIYRFDLNASNLRSSK